MSCEVEYTERFEEWWNSLNEAEQDSVAYVVELLVEDGVALGAPFSSKIIGTKRHHHMRELRIQHAGKPYRVLYAFDPARNAILLLGGDKTGQTRWYEENVPLAEKMYDLHLANLKAEKRTNGTNEEVEGSSG